MKAFKITLFSLIALLLLGCPKNKEVIEKTHPDGTPKKVVVYDVQDDKKVRIEERGYYEGGQMEIIGKFNKKGQKHGKWEYWYDNGNKWSELEFKDNIRHGKNTVWFPNGQKRYEGMYENDEKVGTWRFWLDDGTLAKETEF